MITERNNIIREIRNNSIVIVMGEMGSGKSTRKWAKLQIDLFVWIVI